MNDENSKKKENSRSQENIYKFNGWIMSLSRKKNSNNKENQLSNYDTNSNSVFYTLRKRIQKTFTASTRQNKVKAIEIDMPAGVRLSANSSTNVSTEANDFARIVMEMQNPIQLSSTTADIRNYPIPPVPSSSPSNELQSETSMIQDDQDLDLMMKNVRSALCKHGYYWGSASSKTAQQILGGKPNGSYLVRDSQTEKYLFTLSFRSGGVTLHCRIDYADNNWYYSGLLDPTRRSTLTDLIESTTKASENQVIGYVKQTQQPRPPFPVRLTQPINRFIESSLQSLCRFVIRQIVVLDKINELPLPNKLKEYVSEN